MLRTGRSAVLLLCVATCSSVILGQAARGELAGYGGTHEFGVAAGYSPVSGSIWGYDENVRYLPVLLRYSYRFSGRERMLIRYSPEITPLAIMYEPKPSETNPAAPQRSYGGGVSPVSFSLTFRPQHRVQPFVQENAGMVYFNKRVLSPGGSQYMYTIDFGGGVNLFRSHRSAVSLGYRYQHLSNANISLHNPGTDANTFTLGFSTFRGHY